MKACTLTYLLLSSAFVVVNRLTLCNLQPWIDEVMLLDTVYNAAVHGSCETTACLRHGHCYPPWAQKNAK